ALDSLDHSPEMRNDAVITMTEITPGQDGCCMNGNRFHDDQGSTTDGTLLIIGHVTFTRQTLDRHVGGVSAEDDPVLQGVRAQCERRKKAGKFFRHHGSPWMWVCLDRRESRPVPGPASLHVAWLLAP